MWMVDADAVDVHGRRDEDVIGCRTYQAVDECTNV